MVKRKAKGTGSEAEQILAVIHEAAIAENCFRGLSGNPEHIQGKINRLYEQLDHELGKIATDISVAFPQKQKVREV